MTPEQSREPSANAEGLRYNIALVGSSSLKGKEIKAVLSERGFPVRRLALLDADEAAGQMTEFAEEPAIIQPVRPDQFENISVVFFACLPALTEQHWRAAEESRCEIIDLSYFLETHPQARLRAPLIESRNENPDRYVGEQNRKSWIAVSAHPAAIAVAGIVELLSCRYHITRMVATIYEPTSERGQAGVNELHQQTLNLLSFQELPRTVFDAQVAFNLLWGHGRRSRPTLQQTQERIQEHIRRLLGGRLPNPALRLLQVPVFYGYSFCCFVELNNPVSTEDFEHVVDQKPFVVCRDPEDLPSAVGVAGSNEIILGPVEHDPNCESAYWIWGAMDNLRLAAINAVEIARELVVLHGNRLSNK